MVEQAGDLVRRHPHPALRARYLGMRIVQHLHCGEAGLVEQAAAELVQLGAGTGDPYSSWLGLSARVVGPLLEGDLGSAAQLAEQAYLHANESDLFAGDSAWAGQLVVLGWVSGRLPSFQRPQEAPDLEGPEFAWSAVRALFLALSGDADNATAILAELTPGIGTVGAQWIGFVGVALAVETAALVGARAVLEAAEPVLRRRRDDHVVLGTGVLDLGPVTRYVALAMAGTDRVEAAAELLHEVHADPARGRSGSCAPTTTCARSVTWTCRAAPGRALRRRPGRGPGSTIRSDPELRPEQSVFASVLHAPDTLSLTAPHGLLAARGRQETCGAAWLPRHQPRGVNVRNRTLDRIP